MCLFGGNSSPAPPPEPQKPQEVKQVDQQAFGSTSTARKDMSQNGGMAASTLLTGPGGIENKQMQLSKSTLLGQ